MATENNENSGNIFLVLIGREVLLIWSACLSVHSHISKITRPKFTICSVQVTCGACGYVLFWQQYNMLHTTGFCVCMCFRLTYALAGVNISAGDQLVQRIKSVAKATRRTGCDPDLGQFGGMFDLKSCGYVDPVLVSGTDGVGTKLQVWLVCSVLPW